MPRLYSYVVVTDTGFAPNPYHGYCTIACCKPGIRQFAEVGDWIVGIGSKPKGREGRAVYAMQVKEKLCFENYWNDPRFVSKRPRMDASYKESVGDNAYHFDKETGEWIQEPCQHTESDCTPCKRDMASDLKANSVLIGERFIYWGDRAPELPLFAGEKLFAGRNYKCKYGPEVVAEFLKWFDGREELRKGKRFVGKPADKDMAKRKRRAINRSRSGRSI